MSRLIKKPIVIPAGVTVTQGDGFLALKGPKGEFRVTVPTGVSMKIDGQGLWVEQNVSVPKAMLGTAWALAKNAIQGVAEGYVKVLEIEGVGYRAAMDGKDLTLYLGYALPVKMPIEEGATVSVEKNIIKVSGIGKELVGRVAAEIRALKKPEPYKGKGIHYQGEVIRRKAGKKAGTAAAG
jgi:large subunit ribosomal protein L6